MSNPLQLILPLEGRKAAVPQKQIRRCVRRVHLEPTSEGTYVFRARSFSRRRGQVYRCRVNPRTGRVYCTCKDFMFRHATENPSYWNGHVCKHLQRAIRTVRAIERTTAAPLRLAA